MPGANPAASPQTRGIAIVTLGVLVLTPDGLLTTLVSADIWTMLFWRGLLMAIALTLFSLAWQRRQRKPAPPFFTLPALGVAVLFTSSSVAFVTAVVITSVANTLFLVAVAPLFAAMLAWLFLKERVPQRTITAIAIALAGMAIIFGDGLGRGDILGDLTAVLAAACWAGTLVVLRWAPHTDARLAVACGGYMIAVIALFFAPTLTVSELDALWLGLLGFVVLPISFGLISLGPRYLPAPEVSLIVLLEAVIGPLWAWIFIGQVPTLVSLGGGALIVVTLAVYFLISLRREGAVARA